jgi:uncharacterized membrane protein YdjX (TVP38/TMEM64 family)
MEPRIAPRPPTASEPTACPTAKASANSGLSWGKILPLVVVVGAAVLVFAMGWHRKLSVEALASHRAALEHFIEAHFMLALASYIGIYILAAALSIPGGLFLTIAGGILFGWFVGGLAAALGASIGATILFLVARTALCDFVRQKAGPRVQKLAAGFRADALNYLLFLRLVPLFPFWLVNIAAALLGVGLGTFMIGTSIGILPATFAFAFVGAGLDSVLTAQQQAYQACLAAGNAGCRLDFSLRAAATPQLLLALTALGVLAIVPVILKRSRSRQQS